MEQNNSSSNEATSIESAFLEILKQKEADIQIFNEWINNIVDDINTRNSSELYEIITVFMRTNYVGYNSTYSIKLFLFASGTSASELSRLVKLKTYKLPTLISPLKQCGHGAVSKKIEDGLLKGCWISLNCDNENYPVIQINFTTPSNPNVKV